MFKSVILIFSIIFSFKVCVIYYYKLVSVDLICMYVPEITVK